MSNLWYVLRRRDDLKHSDELSTEEYRAPRGQDGTPRVVWRCPNCRRLLTITNHNHDVRFDGNIYPAVRCPHEGCRFQEWMHLENWIPKAVGEA